MDSSNKNINLTTTEVAERLRLSQATLANWRVKGEGPRFVKFGRRVLYPLAEIEAFEARQLRSNTAQGM